MFAGCSICCFVTQLNNFEKTALKARTEWRAFNEIENWMSLSVEDTQETVINTIGRFDKKNTFSIFLKNPDNFQQSSLYLKIFASFNVDLSNKRQNTRQALKCLSNILKFDTGCFFLTGPPLKS